MEFSIGRPVKVRDGMRYPWLWVLWGKGFGTRTSVYAGDCSMNMRWQLRINVRGYYLALVFRAWGRSIEPLDGWRWWAKWLQVSITHPRAWRTFRNLAVYEWRHRKCDTLDFHHVLGCAVTPEEDYA